MPGGGAVSLASAAAAGVAGVVAGVAAGFVCFWVCVWAAAGWTSDDGEAAASQRAKKCAHG